MFYTAVSLLCFHPQACRQFCVSQMNFAFRNAGSLSHLVSGLLFLLLPGAAEAPEATLELDHVYGFSTLCPGNLLHFLPSGKVRDKLGCKASSSVQTASFLKVCYPLLLYVIQLAYAVGKMVVLLSLEAGRQEFYTQHSHEIRWCALMRAPSDRQSFQVIVSPL